MLVSVSSDSASFSTRFLVFGYPMKHVLRVFDIASQRNQYTVLAKLIYANLDHKNLIYWQDRNYHGSHVSTK